MSNKVKKEQDRIRKLMKDQRKPRKFNVEDLIISPKIATAVVDGVEVRYKTEIDNEDYFEVQQALLGEGREVRWKGADSSLFLFAWRMLQAANPDQEITLETFLKMDPNWTGKFAYMMGPRIAKRLTFLLARTPKKKSKP